MFRPRIASMSIGPHVPILAFLEIDRTLSEVSAADLSRSARVFEDFEAQNIAPILCTGGTRCELEYFARQLKFRHPLLPEDGSAVFIPRGYFGAAVRGARVDPVWEVLDFGPTRRRVIDVIAAAAGRLDITVAMLSRANDRRACQIFGMDSVAGHRVTERLYGEVVEVPGGSEFTLARLRRALRAAHLRCTRRGCHLYVVPDDGGTVSVACLRNLYEQHCGRVGALALVDPDAAAITVPVCDMVARVRPDSLHGVALLTLQIAMSVRRRFPSRSVERPELVQ
jgi:predicted mannosyl-3-phosphoglycerate phosphatase (HAD superfamily)